MVVLPVWAIDTKVLSIQPYLSCRIALPMEGMCVPPMALSAPAPGKALMADPTTVASSSPFWHLVASTMMYSMSTSDATKSPSEAAKASTLVVIGPATLYALGCSTVLAEPLPHLCSIVSLLGCGGLNVIWLSIQ